MKLILLLTIIGNLLFQLNCYAEGIQSRVQKIDSNRIAKKVPSDATPCDLACVIEVYPYAILSQGTYQKNDLAAWKEWHRIDVEFDPDTGYRASIYENKDRKEIVIAYSGTDEIIDGLQDLAPYLNRLPKQYDSGVLAALNYLENKDNDYAVVFTGHSLGGGIAQFVAKVLDQKAITFNTAPITDSVSIHANNLNDNYATTNPSVLGEFSVLNIVALDEKENYDIVADFIGELFGTTKYINVTVNQRFDIQLETLERHSIQTVIDKLESEISANPFFDIDTRFFSSRAVQVGNDLYDVEVYFDSFNVLSFEEGWDGSITEQGDIYDPETRVLFINVIIVENKLYSKVRVKLNKIDVIKAVMYSKEDSSGMEFSNVVPEDRRIYLSTDLGNIYAWDIENLTFNLLASTNLPLTDIAIDPTGRVFGITATHLYRIDPKTGSSSLIGPLNAEKEIYPGVYALDEASGFDISPNGDARISSGNNFVVVFVDLNTAIVSYVFPTIGNNPTGDLWYTNDTSYLVATDPTIFEVGLSTSNNELRIADTVHFPRYISPKRIEGLIVVPDGYGTSFFESGTVIGFGSNVAEIIGRPKFENYQGLDLLNHSFFEDPFYFSLRSEENFTGAAMLR